MLNRIEKIIIDVYLYSIFQDIHGLSSSHKVMALEAIIAPNLAQEAIDSSNFAFTQPFNSDLSNEWAHPGFNI